MEAIWSGSQSDNGGAPRVEGSGMAAHGSECSFFFWKGRVALYAILKALGVGPGDRVMLPGYTCVVVPAAVCFLGAEPLYVDIDSAVYNLSLDGIEAAFKRCGGRVKAVIVQHTYGLPVDTAPIVNWARLEGVSVIEDCCHALGSRYLGESGGWKEVGTLGDASFFSSQWSKPVSTGLGGWALTKTPEIARKLQSFHATQCISPSWWECAVLATQIAGRALVSSPGAYWRAQSTYRTLVRAGFGIGSSYEEELRGEMPRDYAKRMSALQFRVLQYKLARLEGVNRHRQHLQKVYDCALSDAGFSPFKTPHYARPVLLRYPVRVKNKSEVLAAARHNKIELGDWFDHPLHPVESNCERFGYQEGLCPNAEKAAGETINLPTHDRVSEEAAREIVRFLKRASSAVDLAKCSSNHWSRNQSVIGTSR